MKALLVLVVVAGCGGGVSDHPMASWDDTLAAFSDAWCRWEVTCDQYGGSPTGCPDEVTAVMNTDTKPELTAAAQETCVTCMQAYIDVFDADTSPCVTQRTFDQANATMQACGSASCVDLHDLPGSGIR